ncbi:hypothetical protein ANCDUO_26612 [Ancylostoma duodenale]|uniref:Peptidase C1A papain C-terminal domain-containing protein n=1 Tax=Ancylostoma duodenale TaxID=51022 RepID=A0A0C2C1D6_9BILA|nr:hypothetical protein ANCDUO_26612 [Ancylostoma duodenale]
MDSKFLVKPKKEEVLADVFGDEPPTSFDARTHWSKCRSIGTIRDQSACDNVLGFRCQGGWPLEAYKWMQRDGVVTGGKYREKDTCKPYAFYPCGAHLYEPYYGPCPMVGLWPTPTCRKRCQRKYNKSYQDDKHFGK